MSDDISQSNSFIEAFEYLNISHDTDETPNNIARQVPNGTHDLPCRMPQKAGDMDNSDDMESESDGESDVIVVDSSYTLSEVSFICPSDLSNCSVETNLGCDTEASTIPETEDESENEINNLSINENAIGTGTNGITIGPTTMDNLVSTPIKRKHHYYPNSKEKRSFEVTPNTNPEVDTSITRTRSGRAVRQRIDHKFDYSSQTDKSEDNTWDDPDFNDSDDEDDDDEDDEDYMEQKHTEPTRKQRRLSFRSSSGSSSDNISMAETDAIIYLDLSQPVAIACSEPTTDPAVEYDSDFKTRLNKFLGLMPAQRRLYNPMADYELEDNHMDEDDNLPFQSSRLWSAVNGDPSKKKVSPKPKVSVSQMPSLLKTLGSKLTNEMKMLLIDDIVQRANANCFERQTPDHIKEPIDLTGLPSEQQRAKNCQQHKKLPNLLEPCPGYYSFLDSLRTETPLKMCHPLAVKYRQREFEASKTVLAKILFGALNHTIFQCGLRSSITWKSTMNTPSSIVHGFDNTGQRMSRIVLWQQLKQPGILVKALIHEMCHAAAFAYHGETGHGDNCRKWAYRAKSLLPELPEINDCKANYKYTCLLCRARSVGIMKFENEEQQLRCHYCQFEVNVEVCNIQDVYNLSFTDQLVTPYKEFIRSHYINCEQNSHSAKMQLLNIRYKEQLQNTATQ